MKHWVRVRQALLLSLVLLTAWMLPLFRWDGRFSQHRRFPRIIPHS